MRFRNWVYINGILPILDKRHRGLGNLLQKYSAWEHMSADEARHKQWQSLLRLVRHAYDSTGFYKKRFDAIGARPEDIRGPADFQKIPPLTRDDLRLHLDELCSTKYSREELSESHTGGTTNVPATFFRDHESLRHKDAVQAVFNGWADFWPGDRVMYCWGAQADFAPNPSWKWKLVDYHLLRHLWVQTSNLDDHVLESYREQMNRFKPKIVYGYPTTLEVFCQYLRRAGKPWHRPQGVICTAEQLEQRELIEGCLEAPVFEHYGAREFGMIAGQCEHRRSIHLHPAICYAELDPVPGVAGTSEIYMTDLFNYGMPLIRYQSEDLAIEATAPCPCGRTFQSIERFCGRKLSLFHLADGNTVIGITLPYRLSLLFPAVTKTQFIQRTFTDFELRYVSDVPMPDAVAEKVLEMLRDFFKATLTWQMIRVPEIPRERSGKVRPYVSFVTPPNKTPSLTRQS